MQVVQEEVIERFDHKHLNRDTEEFRNLNPTGENIVHVIWTLLKPRLDAHLVRIGLWETPKNFFEYQERTRKESSMSSPSFTDRLPLLPARVPA